MLIARDVYEAGGETPIKANLTAVSRPAVSMENSHELS
jgi:hypothetical protein